MCLKWNKSKEIRATEYGQCLFKCTTQVKFSFWFFMDFYPIYFFSKNEPIKTIQASKVIQTPCFTNNENEYLESVIRFNNKTVFDFWLFLNWFR